MIKRDRSTADPLAGRWCCPKCGLWVQNDIEVCPAPGCKGTMLPANFGRMEQTAGAKAMAKAFCKMREGLKRKAKVKGQPNATEERYRRECLFCYSRIAYEGQPFRMKNGHTYTPDFVVYNDYGRPIECHEVKGSYAMFSQGRARLAFDQCKIEFPGIKWIWAKEKKGGGWKIT